MADANTAAFKAGHSFGETAELFDHPYNVKPATLAPGTYTNITGNTALAWGIVAAGQLAKLPVFLGSYPITPASDILHELSKHKNFGIRTLQAEDEIAGIGAALGAAFGGHLGYTTTSGPGMALKSETMGLAVSLELPLVIIDIQRGGPSTGLPTKTEAADLLMAMYGRHSESPLPIVAAKSPSDCFFAAIEATRIALQLPHAGDPAVRRLPRQRFGAVAPARRRDSCPTSPSSSPPSRTTSTKTATPCSGRTSAIPRRWRGRGRCPGTPGSRTASAASRRKKGPATSATTPQNHEFMVRLRAAKIAGIANDIPDVEVEGDVDDAELLVLGWGSTWGAIDGGMNRVRARGPQDRPCAPAAPQPVPSQPGRRAPALPEGARPRDEPRAAVAAGPGRIPRRRPLGQQGAGHAVHRGRARERHPRRAWSHSTVSTTESRRRPARTG